MRAQIAASVRPDAADELPSRVQVLAALWRMPQDGSVTAAVNLARELRDDDRGDDGDLLCRILGDGD